VNTASASLSAPAIPFREVWLVSIGHCLTHWYPATFYVLLPLIGQELGLSYSQIGLVMTCQFIAAAVANIPGGMAVDSVGRKGFLLALSLFWIGVPYLLMGLSTQYWMLLVCSALVGIGNTLWHPAAIPTLASRFPDRKGLVLSVHGMGGNLGDAIAPLAVGALLGILSWREVMMVNLLPGVIVACLILAYLGTWRLLSESHEGSMQGAAREARRGPAEYLAALGGLLRNRNVVVLMGTSAFRSMTQSTLLVFLPLYLTRELGYAAFAVGVCLFVLQGAGFAASPLAGHLSDRMGRRRVVMSSMAMTAVVLLLMALVGQSPAFMFCIALLGFFLYAMRAVMQAWVLECVPRNLGGTSIGVMFGAQAVGAAIAPAMAGLLADRYGLVAMFYFVTATIVVANLLVLLMKEP
jgi:FSR family fosmidomycin resistance protein-like MFS transporter